MTQLAEKTFRRLCIEEKAYMDVIGQQHLNSRCNCCRLLALHDNDVIQRAMSATAVC